MKIANMLMLALSPRVARAGQNLNVPDDDTNLLQVEFDVSDPGVVGHAFGGIDDDKLLTLDGPDASAPFHSFPMPPEVDGGIGGPTRMAPCSPEEGEGKPCQNCINSCDPGNTEKASWKAAEESAENKNRIPWGAGHVCCQQLSAAQIKDQPLCGVCMRYRAGLKDGDVNLALGGHWGFSPTCAEVYCKAAETRFQPNWPQYMKEVAGACGGNSDLRHPDWARSALKSPAVGADAAYGSVFNPDLPRPKIFLATVANNPRKADIDRVFVANADQLYKLKGHITGTGSSSKQCSAKVCAIKEKLEDYGGSEEARAKCLLGGATTTSGPFAGDVQCGGIIAEDWLDRAGTAFKRAIAGIVFLNDEREPHRLDIISMKRIIEFGLKDSGNICWHERGNPTPKQVIDNVVREFEEYQDSASYKNDVQARIEAQGITKSGSPVKEEQVAQMSKASQKQGLPPIVEDLSVTGKAVSLLQEGKHDFDEKFIMKQGGVAWTVDANQWNNLDPGDCLGKTCAPRI